MNELTPELFCKALADETRARIIFLVAQENELCVCELTCALDETQPKISRHLAQLRNNSLLIDRRQGQWIYYRLNPNLPHWIHTALITMLNANKNWLDKNIKRLRKMADRPIRCC